MSEKSLLNLTNDYIFKRTFGYSGDEDVTKVFLRDIIQTKISRIELDNNPITEKELLDDKVGIMDIKATLNDAIECDIEMQVVKKSDIEKRIMFYWSRVYGKTISQGNGYEKLKKTISILIADFELDNLKEIKKYVTKWNIREEEYYKLILTDVLELYIIEIPKFVKYARNINKVNLNLWVEFIKNPEVVKMDEEKNNEMAKNENDKNAKIKYSQEDCKKEYNQENELDFEIREDDEQSVKETKQAIQKAKARLKKLSEDEHERRLAELRDKYIRDQYSVEKYGYLRGKEDGEKAGLERGIEQGTQLGSQNEKIKIAQNMLSEKIDIETIKNVTGLTEEEIKKYNKDQNNNKN